MKDTFYYIAGRFTPSGMGFTYYEYDVSVMEVKAIDYKEAEEEVKKFCYAHYGAQEEKDMWYGIIAYNWNYKQISKAEFERYKAKANDPKWLNGEYVQCTKNTVTVRDVDGNKFRCSYDDEKYISGEYKNITQGLIFCKDTSTNKYTYKEPSEIDNIRYISKDSSLFHGPTFGKVLVKDKNNKYFYVNKDDENYLNGKLKFMIDWKGRHHKEETKQKMHNTFLKNNHQQGEKNSQYGTCWIHNNSENKKIKKEQLEEYMSNGWIKGRKMKFK